jgi:hypothetical protein
MPHAERIALQVIFHRVSPNCATRPSVLTENPYQRPELGSWHTIRANPVQFVFLQPGDGLAFNPFGLHRGRYGW